MLIIRLKKPLLHDADLDALRNTLLNERHYRYVVRQNACCYRPDGSLLFRFRKNALPAHLTDIPFRYLRNVGAPASNSLRGAVKASPSGTEALIGINPRTGGVTAATLNLLPVLPEIMPYFWAKNARFSELAPEFYRRAAAAAHGRNTLAKGVVVESVKLLMNVQTGAHTDTNRSASLLTAIWKGRGEGAELIFVRWGIAVDVRTGDLLIMDGAEMHGNAPYRGTPGEYERLSLTAFTAGHK